jgi:hypothetical protein
MGVADGVDGAGGGEVGDPQASTRGVEEHRAIEEVAAEDAEVALAGTGAGVEREEVVHLRLVICKPRRDLMTDNHRIRS